MGIKDAIEAGRQIRVEMAMLNAESRILGYDGHILSQIGIGFQAFGKALFAPFRTMGALVFGVSKSHDQFDAEMAAKTRALDSVLAQKKKEWGQTDGTEQTLTIENSIREGLESEKKEATLAASSSNNFWQGNWRQWIADGRRARFERLRRAYTINPEEAETMNANRAASASAGGFAAGVIAGRAANDDGLLR